MISYYIILYIIYNRMVAIDISDADYVHEEEIIRNPHNVKTWLRYAEHKQDATFQELNLVYERALKQLPGKHNKFRFYFCELVRPEKYL